MRSWIVPKSAMKLMNSTKNKLNSKIILIFHPNPIQTNTKSMKWRVKLNFHERDSINTPFKTKTKGMHFLFQHFAISHWPCRMFFFMDFLIGVLFWSTSLVGLKLSEKAILILNATQPWILACPTSISNVIFIVVICFPFHPPILGSYWG